MPFRDRLKKAFGRGGDSPDSASLTKTDSRRNSNVYGPGEDMPKSKYRQPVDKEHREKLESFSFFGDHMRKRSKDSQYSPMGSRIPSRNPSIVPSRAGSVSAAGGLSMSGTAVGGAVGGGGVGGLATVKRIPFSKTQQAQAGQLVESADDVGDTANVGGSRRPSKDVAVNHVHQTHHDRALPHAVEERLNGLHLGQAHDHQPFSDSDLNDAFKKPTRQVSAGV